MKSKNIAQRKATQVTQNKRHNKEFIYDFAVYINEQIENLNILASHVVNIDETNIDFDMVSGVTLANRGA